MTDQVMKWVIKAKEDFNIAKHELNLPEEEISTGPVCFQSQQVVEKLLKAWLIAKSRDFEKTHNLEYLLQLCSEQDLEFKDLDTGNLTFYGVEVRYPDEFYIPSVREAKECLEIALKVRDFVFKKLEIKDEKL